MEKEFKINNFDLIRIFASTQVLVKHSVHHLELKAPFGFALLQKFPGVPIFFAISGFLISASYERNTRLKNYIRNRALRIYPGLWGCILLTIVTASIFGGINFVNAGTPKWVLSQMAGLIYTPDFLSQYGFGSYNGSLWTIPIELQFYVMLPILYLLIRKADKKWFSWVSIWVAFMIIAYIIRFIFPNMGDTGETSVAKLLRYTFIPHFYMFLTGVMLQRFKIYQSNLIYGKGLYWLFIYLAFTYLVPNSQPQFFISMLLLAVCILSIAYTAPSLGKYVLKGNDISYGVYMYHGLVLNIMVDINHLHHFRYLLFVLAASYLLGFFSWTLIEKRFLKKKHPAQLSNVVQSAT